VSFLVTAALAIAILIAAPIAAHLLRRGRAQEQAFPPVALVPALTPVARQRSRLEDRLLLTVRALVIAALAVIGATPFVRCSRLSLSRESGASVAVALIVDDSLSMRAKTDGSTRWQLSLDAARDLLDSAREGDAFAIVLAGRPARLALAATTDLDAARRTLEDLTPSDRSTDLDSAVQLARSALKQLPHVDKRVALLSDLAGAPLPQGEPALWVPLEKLAVAAEDCGAVSAEQRGRRVTVQIACNSSSAARGRFVELFASKDQNGAGIAQPADAAPVKPSDERLARGALAPQPGLQTVSLELSAEFSGLDARLDGSDAIEADDTTPVASHQGASSIALVSDPSTASVATGGTTLLEQALSALEGQLVVRPLPVAPDDARDLEGHAALLLDDPTGLTPETRAAITTWVERGGVAMALLGPRAAMAQLGSTLEPFARGGVRWEATEAKGIDPRSAQWMGAEAQSLSDLAARGRARLGGLEMPGAQVTARWDDGEPWLLETNLGRGLLVAAGLPTSVEQSDFALRPGFLALLTHVTEQALRRRGPRRSVAGTRWVFPASSSVEAIGPKGKAATLDSASADGKSDRVVVPDLAGRWLLRVDGDPQLRLATIEAEEVLTLPQRLDEATRKKLEATREARIDASPQLALVVLALVALEIGLRLLGKFQRRAPGAADRRAA
jgi:Mg-chelatase subunit ChlD